MEIGFYVVLGILCGVFFAWFLIAKKSSTQNTMEGQGMMLLQQQMSDLTKQLDSKLSESRRDMTEAVRTQF